MNNDKENSEQTPAQSSDFNDFKKESIIKLANKLTANETTIDMGSIMRMAQNLFKDDSLMKSVQDLGMINQPNSISVQKSAPKKENLELPLNSELLEKIYNEFIQIKSELVEINANNKTLIEIFQRKEKKNII
ncbi:hypothetical protein BED47_06160 [Gottfriedia luciferensis]|uniref:Uncharacterized protein n=2 Tax=Bacillaceae TaxID=186817 RepID=A0ABX2ZRZ7_9BACI|nr:hypothetical protein [Gottfriedia luciferensis]ODG91244.1 hypothetical protein BED47_06160 [Gottfriedia luciferensis]